MKVISLAPKTMVVPCKADPEVWTRLRVPSRTEQMRAQHELRQYERERVLKHPETNKILRGKSGRPEVRVFLDLDGDAVKGIIEPYVVEIGGISVSNGNGAAHVLEADKEGRWDVTPLLDRSLDHVTTEQARDEYGDIEWEIDEETSEPRRVDGKLVPKMVKVRHTYWEQLLDAVTNPEQYEDPEQGKGEPPPPMLS